MALKIVPYWIGFISIAPSTLTLFCIMAKSKISAPVGFFNAKYKPQQCEVQQTQNRTKFAPKKNVWCQYEKQESSAICQSLCFSLELIPSGKFVTVEFITKNGELRKYNGRTGVKKYLKHVTIGNAERGDYFILWVRRGGIKFDSVAMVHKRRIVKLSAGGVVLWQNKSSRYAKTV